MYALLAANTLIFLYQLSLGPAGMTRFVYKYSLVPAFISHPALGARFGSLGLATFLTAAFLHGGWLHIISNMWVLWLFGDNIEDRLGPARFLFLYLLSGLAANALQYYTGVSSTLPTIGASGAIAGIMGAYFLFFPRARVTTLVPVFFFPLIFDIPAAFFLIVWFLTQFLSGYAASIGPASAAGGVAWWAHVGGFLTGMFGAFILRRTMRDRRWRAGGYRPW